jgi:hypothetical protein
MRVAPILRLAPGVERHGLDVGSGHDEMVADAPHGEERSSARKDLVTGGTLLAVYSPGCGGGAGGRGFCGGGGGLGLLLIEGFVRSRFGGGCCAPISRPLLHTLAAGYASSIPLCSRLSTDTLRPDRRPQLSKEVFVLDTGPAAGAGSGLGARESFLPVQDAFLPVGRERAFQPAMCRTTEGLGRSDRRC